MKDPNSYDTSPRLPFQFTITFTDEPKIENIESNNFTYINFDAYGKLHWNGSQPPSYGDKDRVHVKGENISGSPSDEFAGPVNLTWIDTDGKEYVYGIGIHCSLKGSSFSPDGNTFVLEPVVLNTQ